MKAERLPHRGCVPGSATEERSERVGRCAAAPGRREPTLQLPRLLEASSGLLACTLPTLGCCQQRDDWYREQHQ